MQKKTGKLVTLRIELPIIFCQTLKIFEYYILVHYLTAPDNLSFLLISNPEFVQQ